MYYCGGTTTIDKRSGSFALFALGHLEREGREEKKKSSVVSTIVPSKNTRSVELALGGMVLVVAVVVSVCVSLHLYDLISTYMY